jgi:hypothetical protein
MESRFFPQERLVFDLTALLALPFRQAKRAAAHCARIKEFSRSQAASFEPAHRKCAFAKVIRSIGFAGGRLLIKLGLNPLHSESD